MMWWAEKHDNQLSIPAIFKVALVVCFVAVVLAWSIFIISSRSPWAHKNMESPFEGIRLFSLWGSGHCFNGCGNCVDACLYGTGFFTIACKIFQWRESPAEYLFAVHRAGVNLFYACFGRYLHRDGNWSNQNGRVSLEILSLWSLLDNTYIWVNTTNTLCFSNLVIVRYFWLFFIFDSAHVTRCVLQSILICPRFNGQFKRLISC